MKMNPVIHFEMPAKNKTRVKSFYEIVFGWQITITGAEYNNYVLATTSPVDDKGLHKEKGAINGGFWETKKKEYPHFVISVDDLENHMKIVKKNGGKIEGKPMDIPGIGKFVMFNDTEGNRVGMLQPVEM